jgi:hypothetical protein
MAHNNYKAKWLAALKDTSSTPGTTADLLAKNLRSVQNVDTDAALALNKVRDASIEVAHVAKRVLTLLDEQSEVAGLSFGVIGVELDGKLSQMPLPVMMRRIRDVLRVSEARIGMLSVAANEYHLAYTKVEEAATDAKANQDHLQRALLESTYIGARPSSADLDDYRMTNGEDYARFGLHYEDLDDDWLETTMYKARGKRDRSADDSDDSDEDEENPSSSQAIVSRTDGVARKHSLINSTQSVPL